MREKSRQNPIFHAPPGSTKAAARRPVSKVAGLFWMVVWSWVRWRGPLWEVFWVVICWDCVSYDI